MPDEIQEGNDEEVSLRDSLESAFSEEENSGADTVGSPSDSEQGGTEGLDQPGTGGEDKAGEALADGAPVQEAGESGVEEKVKQPSADAAAADLPKGTEPAGETPSADLKAPTSWRPDVREQWAALPDTVKREVLKREHDMNRGMAESATARQFASEFEQTVAPYMAQIKSENSTPMAAVGFLMNTAYRLRNDPPAQRAELVADIIRDYGVDLQALDGVLTQRIHGGAAPGNGAAATTPGTEMQNWMAQQLAPITQYIQHQQQRDENLRVHTQEDLRTEIQQFEQNPENEFFADVREDMADLMEMSARRGTTLTLQEAYNRAIMARSDIAGVVTQRQLESAAEKATAEAAAARATGISVGGTPPETGSPRLDPNASVRSTLEAAWSQSVDDV